MLDDQNVSTTSQFSSRTSSSQSSGSDSEHEDILRIDEDSKLLDEFAVSISRRALKQGVREASTQLASTDKPKSADKHSYLPFSTIDLTMTQIFCIVSVGWIFAALLRYAFLADGKLATRAPSSPKPFFPSNSSVSDFYRGDGASYAELYNQADLTILMFYSQWSLHSVEARKHFVRLARAFKDTDNVKFSAVNCDVGRCKRSFKLYSYPVIIALTSSNTAVLYEDFPMTELMFSWITKLLSPLHRVDSIDDELVASNKYDHVVMAYLPLNNGHITHAFKVYQLAAMKNKERILFTVTLDQQVADHYDLSRQQFKVLNTDSAYDINVNTTSMNVLNSVHTETDAHRYSVVQWVWRESDDDGGKTVRLHSLVNDSRALLILMTTPLTSLQSSGNLDKMRKMAVIYNDCSGAKQLEVDSTDWTQQFVDESRLACNFRDEMLPDCCNTMHHDNLCSKSKSQSINLISLQYAQQCSIVLPLFGQDKLYDYCCSRSRLKSPLQPTFKQQINCKYFKLLNSSDQDTLSVYSNSEHSNNIASNTILSSVKSHGLACRTNRLQDEKVDEIHKTSTIGRLNAHMVHFAAMDKRYSGHFMRSWNLNTTYNGDYLVLISVDDEALYSLEVEDAYRDIDNLLAGYANTTLEPTIFDETKRKSHFSKVKSSGETDEIDEMSTIERLNAHTFRTTILNDTDRTYSAVVFFSGGSWHGQSMATTQVFHTVYHEFAAFNTLIRFFMIDVSRNSLPWAYVFDSLPAVMFFPAQPFPMSQSSHFPNELVLTVPNMMAFLLARAQPELRFRVALRGCSRLCLETNRLRLHQFEDAVRRDIRMLRLMKRKYAHKFGANFVTLMLRKRKLQMNASRYLQNVLKILHSNQSSDLQLSSMNETLIVRDSLLLRWLLSNNFGTNFNINHSFRL